MASFLSVFSGKRAVQVAPRRATVARRPAFILQEVHAFCGFFLDGNIEREFQSYYRREKQSGLAGYALALVLLSIVFTVAASTDTLVATTVDVATWIAPSTASRPPMDRVHLLSESAGITVLVLSVVLALASLVAAQVHLRRDLYWSIGALDPVQMLMLLHLQCVLVPVVVSTTTRLMLERSYLQDLEHLQHASLHTHTLAFLGVSFMDLLICFLLLAMSVASCMLRLQYMYFVCLVLEMAGLLTAISILYVPYVPTRWSLFAALLVFLLLKARGVSENESSCRREFMSQSKLLNENRRLSSQNIEMQEELTGKQLSYQLHYEMGDILRILCQIKLKMATAHEKKEIDKIITALITNEDLFEVSLDPSKAEHEEEVQGWLHMMAFKDAPLMQSQRTASGLLHSDRKSSRPMVKSNAMVLRTTHSRRMSRNLQNEAKAAEGITKFFTVTEPTIPDESAVLGVDTLPRWLFNTIRDSFFVDMFYLNERCSAPLQAVLITCIEINDFIVRLEIDPTRLSAFAAAVEHHYFKRNPYHNCLHAGSVVADIHFYLRRITLNIDDTTFFVGLIAAAVHDISHPGVSNGFLISTRSKLAITYSDDSVLERMHLAEFYRILSHDKFDIFAQLDAVAKTEVRKLMINMILATDLSRHFQHISKLKSRKFAVTEETRGLDATLIMETLLMLADLGHTAKPFAYHRQWADRIAEEFFRQGEAEERHHLPISPLCDRRQANLPKSQVAFLTLLATPLFATAGDAFAIEEYDTVMTELQANIRTWQELISQSECSTACSSGHQGKVDVVSGAREVVATTPVQVLHPHQPMEQETEIRPQKY